MKRVHTIEDFQKENSKDLRKIIAHKTKGCVRGQEFEDIVSEFYYTMCRNKVLQRYEESKKASFNTWIYTCICNMLANRKRRNLTDLVGKNSISHLKALPDCGCLNAPKDIWDAVSGNYNSLRVDPRYTASAVLQKESSELADHFREFRRYLKKARDTEANRDRMFQYMDLTEQGLNGRSIAQLWKVSDTFVASIRRGLRAHHKRWQGADDC